MSNHPRLYNELAYLWPIISPPGEYAGEADCWREVLQDKLGPGRHHILELGAGGGHNLSYLTQDFQATAVDISPEMLSLSRKLNPEVQHHLGDMRTVRLELSFDGVFIHDAISYMLTESDLSATFETAKMHLRPGGVLLLVPDWVQEVFPGTADFNWVREVDGVRVSIQEHLHDPDSSDTQIESRYCYTIRDNGGVRVEHDTHTTGLFPITTWERLLEESGFQVETLRVPGNEGGYGGILFVGAL